ncbi:HAD family hydrolase [Bowmanella dokdonensis]
MNAVYLFDWGDTLMMDIPGLAGPMCDWPRVETVPGAREALQCLAARARLYLATGARDSTEAQIRRALFRVGLDACLSGYFCQANLGIGKGSADFYLEIVHRLQVPPQQVTMVGDSLEKDILPALEAGLQAIWFNPDGQQAKLPASCRQITSLVQLCTGP